MSRKRASSTSADEQGRLFDDRALDSELPKREPLKTDPSASAASHISDKSAHTNVEQVDVDERLRLLDLRMAVKRGHVCGKCQHGETVTARTADDETGFRRCELLGTRSLWRAARAACVFSPSRFEPLDANRPRSSADEIKHRRQLASYQPIDEIRRPREGEHNCASCDHLGNFNDEHKLGWCMYLRMQCATWHPVYCQAFKLRERERRLKVVWLGLTYERTSDDDRAGS